MKGIKKIIALLFIILSVSAGRIEKAEAANPSCDFINPITDVCWWCIFPIRIGGIKVTLGFNNIDYSDVSSPICVCMTPLPRIGLTVSLWEAPRLAETVYKPFVFPSFCLNMNVAKVPAGGNQASNTVNHARFDWQVHWYAYPLTDMLSIAMDFICLEHTGIDLAWVTELDPTWNDSFLNLITYPETILFANPIAEFACIPERAMTAFKRFGFNALFWCAGNWGTTYPFQRTITDTEDPTASAALAVAKVNAELHRNFVAKKTTGSSVLCKLGFSFTFPKKQYKYQLAKPIKDSHCIPVGEDAIWWTSLKEPIVHDTYHVFVIWRKRDCCAF